MERKNNGLMVLVIILSLLVVGLGCYVIYDKFINVEDNNKVVDNNDVNENNNDGLEVDNERKNALKSFYSKFSGKYVSEKVNCPSDEEIENGNTNGSSEGFDYAIVIDLKDDGTFVYKFGVPCGRGTSGGWIGEYMVDNGYLYLVRNDESFSNYLECSSDECFYPFGAPIVFYRYTLENDVFTIYADEFKTKLEKIK